MLYTEVYNSSDGKTVTDYYGKNAGGEYYVKETKTEDVKTDFVKTVTYNESGKKTSETYVYDDDYDTYHKDYYDSFGKKTKSEHSYKDEGNVTVIFWNADTDVRSSYIKDNDGNLIFEEEIIYGSYEDSDGTVCTIESVRTTIEYSDGKIVTTVYNNNDDGTRNTWTVTTKCEDDNNSVKQYKTINGQDVLTKEYVVNGNIVEKTIIYSYDENGNQISKTEITYDDNGVRTEKTEFEDGREPVVKHFGKNNSEISEEDYSKQTSGQTTEPSDQNPVQPEPDAYTGGIDDVVEGEGKFVVKTYSEVDLDAGIKKETTEYTDGSTTVKIYTEINKDGEISYVLTSIVETIINPDKSMTVVTSTYEDGVLKKKEGVDGQGNTTLEVFLYMDGQTYSAKFVNGQLVFGEKTDDGIKTISETPAVPQNNEDMGISTPATEDIPPEFAAAVAFDLDKVTNKNMAVIGDCSVSSDKDGNLVLSINYDDGSTIKQTYSCNRGAVSAYTVEWKNPDGTSQTDTYEVGFDGVARITNRERTNRAGDTLSTTVQYDSYGNMKGVRTEVVEKDGYHYIYQEETQGSAYKKVTMTQYNENTPNNVTTVTTETNYNLLGGVVSTKTTEVNPQTGETTVTTKFNGYTEISITGKNGVTDSVIKDAQGTTICAARTEPVVGSDGTVSGTQTTNFSYIDGQWVLSGVTTRDLNGRMTSDTTYLTDPKGNVHEFYNEYLEGGRIIQYEMVDGKAVPYNAYGSDGTIDNELLKAAQTSAALRGVVNDYYSGSYGYGSSFNSQAFINDWIAAGGDAYNISNAQAARAALINGASLDDIINNYGSGYTGSNGYGSSYGGYGYGSSGWGWDGQSHAGDPWYDYGMGNNGIYFNSWNNPYLNSITWGFLGGGGGGGGAGDDGMFGANVDRLEGRNKSDYDTTRQHNRREETMM